MTTDQIEVGMGVTQRIGSDCYPYTVIEVVNAKTIVVQADNYRRTDNNGLSEHQEYEYSRCPDAGSITLTLRKNGRWKRRGAPLSDHYCFSIGNRRAYQDPCF